MACLCLLGIWKCGFGVENAVPKKYNRRLIVPTVRTTVVAVEDHRS